REGWEAAKERRVCGKHTGDLSLLKHHLRNEHCVLVAGPPPRKLTPASVVPAQKASPERRRSRPPDVQSVASIGSPEGRGPRGLPRGPDHDARADDQERADHRREDQTRSGRGWQPCDRRGRRPKREVCHRRIRGSVAGGGQDQQRVARRARAAGSPRGRDGEGIRAGGHDGNEDPGGQLSVESSASVTAKGSEQGHQAGFWADEEADLLATDREHVIRDSKTPSGDVLISNLRGPIITDALYRTF